MRLGSESLGPALNPSKWRRTLAAIRGVLRASVLRLEAAALPPDDPRVRGIGATRLDDCFCFSRDMSAAEAWQAVEQGLASLLGEKGPPKVAWKPVSASQSVEQSRNLSHFYVKSLNTMLDAWRLPSLPPWPGVSAGASALSEVQARMKTEMRRVDAEGKSALERTVLEWLFVTVKMNVKRQRGRFLLDDAIKGEANCLGYAKLFRSLAPGFGLDCGIVEVVVDNARRLSPHQANLFRFADDAWQLADAWYGSTDIKHRRLGLRVREHGRWRTRDADVTELTPGAPVAGLRRQEIDAITYYILGNRRLANGETAQAIDCYNAAHRLYPTDTRPLFNRAVAWEQMGKVEKAAADYAQALKDEAALTRVLAKEHDEVTNLIQLDAFNVSQRDQQVYLLRKGFRTGEVMPETEVAARTGLSADETQRIVKRVDELLG